MVKVCFMFAPYFTTGAAVEVTFSACGRTSAQQELHMVNQQT
jgi:hypothetical protein